MFRHVNLGFDVITTMISVILSQLCSYIVLNNHHWTTAPLHVITTASTGLVSRPL